MRTFTPTFYPSPSIDGAAFLSFFYPTQANWRRDSRFSPVSINLTIRGLPDTIYTFTGRAVPPLTLIGPLNPPLHKLFSFEPHSLSLSGCRRALTASLFGFPLSMSRLFVGSNHDLQAYHNPSIAPHITSIMGCKLVAFTN